MYGCTNVYLHNLETTIGRRRGVRITANKYINVVLLYIDGTTYKLSINFVLLFMSYLLNNHKKQNAN